MPYSIIVIKLLSMVAEDKCWISQNFGLLVEIQSAEW